MIVRKISSQIRFPRRKRGNAPCHANLLRARKHRAAPEAAARLMREVRAPESPEKLSEREVEVLRLVAQGMANKSIARDLGITERTVKAHVGSILAKLHLDSRTQAALYAGRIGLIPHDQIGGNRLTRA